jgi:putative addiction module killer protein
MQVQITEVYRDWIQSLRDKTIRARIQVRVDRLVHGNPGQFRVLTTGVCEYFTERAGVLIVLLAGGDKSTQFKDIQQAIALAQSL